MEEYREVEHIADIGLEVYGNTVEDIFINSVKGLFHFISPKLKVGNQPDVFPEGLPKNIIEIEGATQEEILVHWLNEFIYNFFVKNIFPKTIKINVLTDKMFRAEIEFSRCSDAVEINLEVKAATYHNLSIQKVKDKYQVRIIFDV